MQNFFDLLKPDVSSEHSELLNELTIVIKTFERYKTLSRLLRSIRKHYPSVKIIIVDDSLHPEDDKKCSENRHTHNSWISAGRNEALKYVSTKYTLFIDDDFVFFRKKIRGQLVFDIF